MRILVILLGVLIGTGGQIFAANPAGGSIQYTYMGPGSTAGSHRYYIEAHIFQDCLNLSTRPTTMTMTASCSSSGVNSPVLLTHVPFVPSTPTPHGGPYSAINMYTTNLFGEEVSDLCDSILNPTNFPNSSCRNRGSSIPGYIKFIYAGTAELSGCNHWVLGVNAGCCRGTGANAGQSTIYLETQLNTLDFPKNSAPVFSRKIKPFPSACVNTETSYGVGSIDPDGDSLVYVLTCSQRAAQTCINYNNGFSASMPISNFSLDSVTGYMKFKTSTAGKYVVSYWVKEYERCTGKWKGQTLRDITFVVNVCTNNNPIEVSGIANLTGKNVQKLGRNKVQVCNGEFFSFTDTIKDPDLNDTIIFKTNVYDALPGASMRVQHLAKNLAVVTFTWLAKLDSNPLRSFFLEYNDDYCMFPGHGLTNFTVEIINSTTAGNDVVVCLGKDTAVLEASGGHHYTWRTLSGDSLIWSGPNRNVWGDTTINDTNKTIKFIAYNTTYLEVYSDPNTGCFRAQACKSRDTVKVTAAKDYSLTTSRDTMICFHDSSVGISTIPDSSNYTFSYQWAPSASLSRSDIFNPIATPVFDQVYKVTVTSDSGCIKYDSVKVSVSTPLPDTMHISLPKKTLCPGETSQLTLNMGYKPSTCAKATRKCQGIRTIHSSRSTNNTNNSSPNLTNGNGWPCPYGATEYSLQQYLIRPTELQSWGIGAGIIEGLGFNVVNVNSVTSLKGYTIKLQCVNKNLSSLNSFINSNNKTQVFNPKTISIKKGWNFHVFDNGYDYDGQSALLVEICWDNSSVSTNTNAEVAYTATPSTFPSCWVGYSNASSLCNLQNPNAQVAQRFNRPNFGFMFCGAKDSTEYTYKWIPSTGLSNDTSYSPKVTVQQNSRYKVVITDTFKKCVDSAFIDIDVSSFIGIKDTIVCPGDSFNLKASVQSSCTNKGTYSWSPGSFLNDSTAQSPKALITQTTQFVVSYNDPCGCKLKDTITVVADSLRPKITVSPPSCTGNTGKYELSPGGGSGPYRFSIDSGKSYQTDSVFRNISSGIYHIRIMDSNDCRSVIIPDTLLSSGSPIIDTAVLTHLSCFGVNDGQILLQVSNLIPGSQYSVDSGKTWQNSILFQGLSQGVYTLFAKGPLGCWSLPTVVSLNAPPEIKLNFATYIDSCYQLGHGWAKATSSGGTGKLTQSWVGQMPNATHSPQIIGDSIYSQLFKFNTYKLLVTDSLGCVVDTTFSIEETPDIQWEIVSATKTRCFGSDDAEVFIKLSGGNKPQGGISYLFSADSGKHYVGPTYGAKPSETYLSKSINQFPISQGNIKIQAKDHKGCSSDTVISIQEPPKVELWATQDSHKVCVSTCIKMEVFSKGGNNPKHTYHWTPTISNTNVANICPTEQRTYTVYCTDSNGCSSNHQLMFVDLYDSLKVDAGLDTSICQGDFAQLRAIPKGGKNQGYKFTWSPFNDLSNAFVSNPQASPNTKQKYFVKLSDECGSYPVKDSIEVSILALPKPSFYSDSTAGCPPFFTTLINTSTQVSRCLWHINNLKDIESCNSATYSFLESGKKTVGLTVYSSDGCKSTLTKENYIEVFPNPVADFSMDPQPTNILETTIEFTDLSDGRIRAWNWNFAGMDTSFERNPKFRFPDKKGGDYLVRLDVFTDRGCTDNKIDRVIIDEDFYIYIPTAFTPNNDGLNDTWKPIITGLDYDFYEVHIFDRWGKLVFESNNASESWDGKINGELSANNVFTYRLIVGDKANEKNRHTRHGNISIGR